MAHGVLTALQTIEKTRKVIQQTFESIRRSDEILERAGHRMESISEAQLDCTEDVSLNVDTDPNMLRYLARWRFR